MRLRSLLQPDWNFSETIPELPIKELHKRHIEALILDVDCTLIPHSEVKIPYTVGLWIKEAQKLFTIYLFSNNPCNYRIGQLGKIFNISFTTAASKPRSEILNKVISEMSVPSSRIALIGDRRFADILTGNQLGLFTVLVAPLITTQQSYGHYQLQRIEYQLSCWLGVPIN